MRKRKDAWKKKLNNEGSTLITVLVGTGFLLVLAAIAISVSAANLHMKQIEYTMKNNFYADEQILDDVYNGIGKVTTDCLAETYAEVLSQVSQSSGKTVFKTQDAAYRAFSMQFLEKFSKIMPVCNSGSGSVYEELKKRLDSYITKDDKMAEVVGFNRTEILDEDGNVWSTHIGDKLPSQYVFRDVTVKYKRVTGDKHSGYSETGYEATITTDIVIDVPYINFFRDSSLILDYALIGNEGIYFKGSDKGEKREIEGNVYGGVSSVPDENVITFRDEDVPGGINFYNCSVEFDSNYLISKGDMNIRNANISIGNEGSEADTQLWVETLRTVEGRDRNAAVEKASLLVNGNMYVANDLELNARESEAVLKGSYYGYSNGSFGTRTDLENQEYQKLGAEGKYTSYAHTQSSAMIINGNRSKLDLSGLDTLVLAGVAYVDMRSQAYLGEDGSKQGRIEEMATGESLALRSSQYMYLAPSACLYTSNPVKSSEIPAEIWNPESTWFGITKGYVNAETPVVAKEVINKTTKEAYTYFYLNFEDGKRTEYANVVLNMINPENDLVDMKPEIKSKWKYDLFDEQELLQIWEVKKEVQNKALSSQVKPEIQLADAATASIYTQGAMTQIASDGYNSLASQLPVEENLLSLDDVTKVEHNLVKHYQYLYAELDPKSEFSLMSDALPVYSSTVGPDAPVSKYVDFAGMIASAESPKYKCGYKTYVYKGDFILNDSNFEGIIICDGNVTITGGSNVEGLVIAKGKITVEGGGSITANRSIVQAILDEEMTEESKKEDATKRNMKYASTYLKEFKIEEKDMGKDYSDRISSTEYTDYISYQNWRKGEV